MYATRIACKKKNRNHCLLRAIDSGWSEKAKRHSNDFRMMLSVRTNGCAGGLLCRPGSSNCLQVLTLPCNEEYNLTKLPNDHIERVEPLENGRTLEGSDMLQVFCIATTEAEAEGVVFKILQTGITRESIFVVTGCSEMDHVALPIRELRRHVRIGLGIGASVGWFVGTAMIVLLASVAPPSTGEALLIPLNTALAGMVLGTVAGASGGFCRPRISPNLARHYEEEVRRGRVLISVELHDARNRDNVAAAFVRSGGMDVHYSDEIAA